MSSPSSFDFFSKLDNIYEHGTRKQALANFHYNRVRTDCGKKCCNKYDLVHGIVLKSLPLLLFFSCEITTAGY